jgi:hypothetical protein
MSGLGTTEFWERLSFEPARLAAEVCFIDVVNLDDTLQQHASLHAWVNAAEESARIGEERARWNVTRSRAIAILDAKSTPDQQTGKPKLAAVLEAEADTALAMQVAMDELHVAQEKRGALRAISRALEDRKDMLIQISAKRRQEESNYQR